MTKTTTDIKTIPIIEEFLSQWRSKAEIYYNAILKEMIKLEKECDKTINAYNNRWNLSEDDRKNLVKDHESKYEKSSNFQKMHGEIYYNVFWHRSEYKKHLNKMLDKEVNKKRQNLIIRIEKKAGNILDANGLYIADNGEINGFIIGDIKTVEVKTIYAGGYNIQCLHYRVLIK
mgnify:CR=1 FL=1